MTDAITLENVSKRLGGRQILRDVTFSVGHGDVFGYLGPNGAGKTTTIRILLGLVPATSGKALVLGQDVRADASRRKLGFVLEADGLYDNLSARDNLNYYSRIYGVARPADRIAQVLKLVGLADRAKDKVGTYSKGMRQRLALARAMVPDPDLLILDEPTAGVDPTGQIEVRQVILGMAKEGKTILLSSHNLDEVQRVCNRIALIDRGQIKLYGERDKLQRQMGKGEVLVETTEPIGEAVLAELLGRNGIAVHEKRDNTLVLTVGDGSVPDIVAFLANRGVRIEQVKRLDASLEEIYSTILKESESR